MATKVCRKCSKRLRLAAFGNKTNGQPRSRCRSCLNAARRAKYAVDSAPARAASAAWRADEPLRRKRWFRDNHLMKKYGINSDDVDTLLAKQDGRCGICRTTTPTKIGWAVDHDHTTNKVRGILCNQRNAGIGYLQDSYLMCCAAANYLNKHGQ